MFASAVRENIRRLGQVKQDTVGNRHQMQRITPINRLPGNVGGVPNVKVGWAQPPLLERYLVYTIS